MTGLPIKWSLHSGTLLMKHIGYCYVRSTESSIIDLKSTTGESCTSCSRFESKEPNALQSVGWSSAPTLQHGRRSKTTVIYAGWLDRYQGVPAVVALVEWREPLHHRRFSFVMHLQLRRISRQQSIWTDWSSSFSNKILYLLTADTFLFTIFCFPSIFIHLDIWTYWEF